MQERPCRDVPGSLLDHDTKILKKNSSKQNQVTLLLAIAALYYRRSRPLHRTPDSKQCCSLVTQKLLIHNDKNRGQVLLTCDMFCIESQLMVDPFTTPPAWFKRMRKPVTSRKSRRAICHVEAQALTTLDLKQ